MVEIASETSEARILRVLSKKKLNSEQIFCWVRPQHFMVSGILSTMTLVHKSVSIPCPKDEQKRVGGPLANERGNQITLCPLSKEAFKEFAERVQRLDPEEKMYIIFSRSDSGQWEIMKEEVAA